MHRAVGQLTSMVDDLFELVQVDAGAIENETERAHVQDVVASAVAAVAVHASGKGVLISADVDGLQDATCSPRLLRVLQNLLVNAVRHTPADGTVQIAGVLAASRLTLTVRDSGEGIPPEALPFVFDPFYREDLARSGGGAGLGLALAQRIVQALGGSIKVASRPRQCTMFEVILPTDVATPQPRRPASPAPAAS
jgi:signal transduction histidine kinase